MCSLTPAENHWKEITAMQLYELVKRNMRIYLRDKGAVFFSLLSMVIVIALMLFFLGDMYIEDLTGAFAEIPGRDAVADETNATVLLLQWIAAGIVGINAVTVTLAVYSAMIKDRSEGRLNSIYTAPVSRFTIASGYVIAAWICSVIICVFTLAISEIYCIIKGGEPYTLAAHFKLLGMIGANSFTYAALMYLIAMLAKTEGAWSGLGTVVGTLVGFVGGIYLPIGNYSEGIASAIKCLPVIYGTKMFRSVMTASAEAALFDGIPQETVSEYRIDMGTDLEFFGAEVSDGACIAVLLICGVVFLLAGALVTKYMKKTDR